jgi:restriction system protein
MSAMRVLDQAKANSPKNLVSADDVRAIFGVLRLDPGATKGIIITTSDFCSGRRRRVSESDSVPT